MTELQKVLYDYAWEYQIPGLLRASQKEAADNDRMVEAALTRLRGLGPEGADLAQRLESGQLTRQAIQGEAVFLAGLSLGLELGADDYVTKPFSLAVLRARVNNLLRRAHSRRTVLELPPFTFDFQEMTYTRNGVPLELSRTEQRLLRLLAEHRGQTLPRARLLEQVWDGGEFVDENALSVAVNRLRAKLTDAPIRTVYGVGYVWAVEP